VVPRSCGAMVDGEEGFVVLDSVTARATSSRWIRSQAELPPMTRAKMGSRVRDSR